MAATENRNWVHGSFHIDPDRIIADARIHQDAFDIVFTFCLR